MTQSQKDKKAAAKARAKQKAKLKNGTGRIEAIANLKETNGQLQTAMLNIRQMYDQKVMEAEALKQQVAQRDQLITAIAVDGLTVSPERMQTVAEGTYVGYETEYDEDEGLTFFVVAAEEVDEDEGETDDESDGGAEGTEE